MLTEVQIQNFKSIQDLSIKLGRINVIIGANGSGKSNILEAIAMGIGGLENKVSKDSLEARGVRYTDNAKLMQSAFNVFKKKIKNDPIITKFELGDKQILFVSLTNDNQPYSSWVASEGFQLTEKTRKEVIDNLGDLIEKDFNKKLVDFMDYAKEMANSLEEVSQGVEIPNDLLNQLNPTQVKLLLSQDKLKTVIEELKEAHLNYKVKEAIEDVLDKITDFVIYSPEFSSLRQFEEESQIEPLGLKGQGLFKLISVMSENEPEEFKELVDKLEIIDWFETLEIPKDLNIGEKKIRIRDKYLKKGMKYFDQRSSNEGFLFLLFYFALFISKYTPKFFAIDNIDSALNPKLCSELMKILIELAKKYDKQVIFTTHNPAILDGLDLEDEEQRLFVAYRNIEGHTKVTRNKKQKLKEGEKPVRLSEQFLRGYLGGLQKNF